MKPTRAQLEHAVEALRLVLRFDYPADSVLSRYFRGHHQLGQQDRAFIAEAVFGVLRRKRLLDHLTASAEPRHLLLAWLSRVAGVSARELEPALRRADTEVIARVKSARTGELPLAVQAELPDWVVDKLTLQHSPEEVLALGRGLCEPAPLDLRVNTLQASRPQVLDALQAGGLTVQATPYSPYGIRVAGKPAINRNPLFLDGMLEVQDEGSQLLCCLLAPTRHELVVDFCAGAGGKTLMLGAMMNSQGRLYAFDTSASRLRRFQPRLARSGLSNVHPQAISSEHDTRIKRLAGKIDRVLVDAPCSGFGTLRRNPDLKWRQSPQSVSELAAKQMSILRAAATLVKPGGRLVYATCSLLAEENEAIVERFVAEHSGFTFLNSSHLLTQQGIAIDSGNFLRLAPHTHNTDGFFGAAMTRTR